MLEELRWVQVVLCLIAMSLWVVFAFQHRRYWGYSLAPILFLSHILVFNIARMLGFPTDVQVANTWSISIRVMGIIAAGILGGGLLFDLKHNGYNGYVE